MGSDYLGLVPAFDTLYFYLELLFLLRSFATSFCVHVIFLGSSYNLLSSLGS